ncbi:hypothetical protein L7F22_024965 [Adiantum nelumboides]|nr:hypothetical protein [Adiantum nelumboides]
MGPKPFSLAQPLAEVPGCSACAAGRCPCAEAGAKGCRCTEAVAAGATRVPTREQIGVARMQQQEQRWRWLAVVSEGDHSRRGGQRERAQQGAMGAARDNRGQARPFLSCPALENEAKRGGADGLQPTLGAIVTRTQSPLLALLSVKREAWGRHGSSRA